jgi:hypothetical protein
VDGHGDEAMRYSTFATQKDIESYRAEVQAACDKNHIEGQPHIIICPFQVDGEWVICLPYEPAKLQGVIKDEKTLFSTSLIDTAPRELLGDESAKLGEV